MSKNVSDQLVETLVAAEIKRIYAVTGDCLNYIKKRSALNTMARSTDN